MKRMIKAGSYWEDEELCERDGFEVIDEPEQVFDLIDELASDVFEGRIPVENIELSSNMPMVKIDFDTPGCIRVRDGSLDEHHSIIVTLPMEKEEATDEIGYQLYKISQEIELA